jgi:hypothetical protein
MVQGSTAASWRLAWYLRRRREYGMAVYSNSAMLVRLSIIQRLEKGLSGCFELFAFKNSYMAYCPVPFPHILLAQLDLEWYASFDQWYAKEGLCGIILELVIKYLLPFLVAIARLMVVKSPGQIARSSFPTRHRP